MASELTLNCRMLPPVNMQAQSITVHGARTYNISPGTVLDVPYHDMPVLRSNNWIFVAYSGTTAQRPISQAPGFHFYDTTLSLLIIWDGATWRNAAGTSV